MAQRREVIRNDMYSFVDTVRGESEEKILPAEAVSINGSYIENEIDGYRTLQVTGRELLESEITDKETASVDGSAYQYKRNKPRIIRVIYQLLSDTPEEFREKFNQLCGILEQEEAKLVFYDEPDKYFIGTKSTVGDVNGGALNVVGEYSFYCTDPHKYSTVEKSFPAAANSDGILEATIVNTGTESVPISYEITHNHENGYLGIVSEHGVMQFGDIDEVDKETRQKSQRLINYKKYSDFSAMTDGAGILDGGHTDYPMNGAFGSATINGKQVLALANAGSGSTWHGAAKQITFPKDSNNVIGAANFFVQSKIWFETGKVEQTGVLEMVLGDEDGKHLASIHIVKQSTTANQASCIVQIQEKELGRHKYEPRADSVTTGDKGIMYIKKSGEVFEFYGAGKKYTFNRKDLKNKKAKTLTLFLGQYGTRGISNLIARMYVMELSVQKNNVTYRVDIPNRYPEGSKVFIDGETRRFYVDGIQEQRDEVRGTKWFEAPPGTTKVQFYHSDFSSPVPTITAKIREAYL